MRLLLSEQKAAVEAATKNFRDHGHITIHEPCDCGAHIRHNNGGNYHTVLRLRREGRFCYLQVDSTCEFAEPPEWEIIPDSAPDRIIQRHADWLAR